MNRLAMVLFIGLLTALVAAGAAHGQAIDFYGKKVSVLKVFGQRNWREAAAGAVSGGNIAHASGVVVDRSLTPNALYVFDSGNNRILGFRSLRSKTADLVLGQPDVRSSAANGDCNLGMFGPPSATSLCLTAYPVGTNFAEQWMRHHLDVDAHGNLYVADAYNDRILVYYAPFSTNRTGGKGDTIADLVLGQADFTSNGPNRGRGPGKPDAESLHISLGGFDHVASRGVSVDRAGNIWVADTFNHRVLCFPEGKTTADLVLGQKDFTSTSADPDMKKATLGTLCTPTIARVEPDTGELYVVDEYPGGFPARILVFKPPFRNGMDADRELPVHQRLEGDYKDGYRVTHATGLVFNTFKTDDLIEPGGKYRYRDGLLWLCDISRCLLLNKDGDILLAIGAPDTIKRGGRYDVYDRSGLSPESPFNILWPGGMIGLDSNNSIYLADEHSWRISRYALPYRIRNTAKGPALPAAAGGLFAEQPIDAVHWRLDRVGMVVFKNQLIVRDHQRYMVWNDYLKKPAGATADLIIGQDGSDNIRRRNNIVDRSHHAIDDKARLWAGSEHGKLILYQLPFRPRAEPLRTLIPLFWADAPEKEIEYRTNAVAFDPIQRHLWVNDVAHHRLLRVRSADAWRGKLLVDAVIGQKDKTSGELNRGMPRPDADTLGEVNSIRFDRLGNLFVVDNTYEGHPNGRVIAFLAEDLRAIKGMFPKIKAKRLYCVEKYDQTEINRIHRGVDDPFSPVSVAFSKASEMVIGNDGYYRDPKLRAVRQLFLYKTPLDKATPDAVIELPLGAAAEMWFDDADNLVVLDHTWNRVWVIDYHRDPGWLRPLE
jgi:DNA-binding beta-propeller fold protein YncE